MNTPHPTRPTLAQFISTLLAAFGLAAATPAHAQHDAHVHGEAEMTLAWASQMLVIELNTPAYNLFGKPAPESDAEFAKLNALKNGQWFKFVDKLNCPITAAELKHPFADSHADEHEHEHSDEAHNDVKVLLSHHCPYDPGSLDFSALFAAYPSLHEIHVQWLTDSQQSAAELHADEAVLSLQ